MTRQLERFKGTENIFALGKNGGYTPSSLGSKSIIVGKQANSETKFLRFDNFNSVNSKVYLSYLNRFMMSRLKEIYGLYLKEMLF